MVIQPLPGDVPEPRAIGDSLDKLGAHLGLPTRVLRVWDEVVGESLAAHVQPRQLHHGVLVVEFDDPAWGSQIGWIKADLVARLAAVLGPREVTEIEARPARS